MDLSVLIGKKVKVTKPNGSFFFGVVKGISETHVAVLDERLQVLIYAPIECEFAEAR